MTPPTPAPHVAAALARFGLTAPEPVPGDAPTPDSAQGHYQTEKARRTSRLTPILDEAKAQLDRMLADAGARTPIYGDGTPRAAKPRRQGHRLATGVPTKPCKNFATCGKRTAIHTGHDECSDCRTARPARRLCADCLDAGIETEVGPRCHFCPPHRTERDRQQRLAWAKAHPEQRRQWAKADHARHREARKARAPKPEPTTEPCATPGCPHPKSLKSPHPTCWRCREGKVRFCPLCRADGVHTVLEKHKQLCAPHRIANEAQQAAEESARRLRRLHRQRARERGAVAGAAA